MTWRPNDAESTLMFSLYEIVQNAQGGQAVDNLAKQFKVSPDQADAAVKALMPAISAAFLKRADEPAAFGSILGALDDSHHHEVFADPAAAQSQQTAQKGEAVAQHLFGSTETYAAVAQRAGGIAGLPPALIQQMAPVIVSMVMGGLSKGLANQGWGGVFGQLASAAGPGGLGAILGGLLGGAPAAQAHPQINPQPLPPGAGATDGLGGLGSILGGLLGGAPAAQAHPQAGASPGPYAGSNAGPGAAGGILGSILSAVLGGRATGGAAPQAGAGAQASAGIDPHAVQSGLEALIKMLQPGTPPPPNAQHAGLQDEIAAILAGKRS
jgi:hypothetical protein